MAIDNKGLSEASRGTLFLAPENTPLPENVGDFILGASKVGDWENFGHTSNNTRPSFTTNGGQANNLDTWLQANVATTYSDTTGTLTIHSVQGDNETLKTIYNGDDYKGGVAFGLDKQAQRKALFLMWQDPTGARAGVYMPSCDVTYNALPNLGNNNGFVEYSMSANILTSPALPVDSNGRARSIAYFGPAAFGALTPVSAVSVTPGTVSVKVGASQALTASVEPSSASQSVMWTSSNPSVAEVDADGKVTGVAQGATTVTAASVTDLSKKADVAVTVTAA